MLWDTFYVIAPPCTVIGIWNLVANGAEKIQCAVGMAKRGVLAQVATALKASSCTFQEHGAFFVPLKIEKSILSPYL